MDVDKWAGDGAMEVVGHHHRPVLNCSVVCDDLRLWCLCCSDGKLRMASPSPAEIHCWDSQKSCGATRQERRVQRVPSV